VVDAGTDVLDDRRALVTEDDARGTIPLPVDDMEVRVTHASRHHANTHLPRPRRVEDQLLDPGRLLRSVEDDATHPYRLSHRRILLPMRYAIGSATSVQ
jgi:hypothetical protein